MKFKHFFLMFISLLLFASPVFAEDFNPRSNIDMKDEYNITNVPDIEVDSLNSVVYYVKDDDFKDFENKLSDNRVLITFDVPFNNTLNISGLDNVTIKNYGSWYWSNTATPMNRTDSHTPVAGTRDHFIDGQNLNNFKLFNYGTLEPRKINDPNPVADLVMWLNNSNDLTIYMGEVASTSEGFWFANSNNVEAFGYTPMGTTNIVPVIGECLTNFDIHSYKGQGVEAIDLNAYCQNGIVHDIVWEGASTDEIIDVNAGSNIHIYGINARNSARSVRFTTTAGNRFGTCAPITGGNNTVTSFKCMNCTSCASLGTSDTYVDEICNGKRKIQGTSPTETSLELSSKGIAANTVYFFNDEARSGSTNLLRLQDSNTTNTAPTMYLRNYGLGKSLYILSDAISESALDVVVTKALATAHKYVARFATTDSSSVRPVVGVIQAGTGSGIFIDQNGDGIGLHIDSEATTKNALKIETIVTDNDVVAIYNQGVQTGGLGLMRLHQMHVNSSRPALYVDNDGTGYNALFDGGNVGINTTTPTSALDVSGTIKGIDLNVSGTIFTPQIWLGINKSAIANYSGSRPLTTNAITIKYVCPSGCDYTSAQTAINELYPYFVRHRTTIILKDSYNLEEHIQFPLTLSSEIAHETGGSVSMIYFSGNCSNINAVKVKSIHVSGSVGAVTPIIQCLTVTDNDPHSDENVSIAVYGGSAVIQMVNLSGVNANYGVMAYGDAAVSVAGVDLGNNDLIGGFLAKHMGHFHFEPDNAGLQASGWPHNSNIVGSVTGRVFNNNAGIPITFMNNSATGGAGLVSTSRGVIYDASNKIAYGFETFDSDIKVLGELSGDLNLSNLNNAEFQCGSDTYMTNFSAVGESVVCTGISDVYVFNTGDTITGPINISGKLVVTVNSGGAATIGGNSNVATGRYAIAMGNNTNASGYVSTAMGMNTKASGDATIAMGKGTTASGHHSTAMGYNAKASGKYGTAIGYATTASGETSFATGRNTDASAIYSTAMGYATNASGDRSTALGDSTKASGVYSFAANYGSRSGGTGSVALGYRSNASGDYSTAIGREIESGGDFVFAVSLSDLNGTIVSQSNTMSVMGGYVGINTTTPTSALEVTGTIVSDAVFIDQNGNVASLTIDSEATTSNAIYVPTQNTGGNVVLIRNFANHTDSNNAILKVQADHADTQADIGHFYQAGDGVTLRVTNLGIGNSLDINHDGTTGNSLSINNAGTGNLINAENFIVNSTGAVTTTALDVNGDLVVNTSNLFVDVSSVMVGINTLTPAAKLDVAHTNGGEYLRLSYSADETFYNYITSKYSGSINTGNDISFYVGTTAKAHPLAMKIDGAGNLQVTNNLNASGLIKGADYYSGDGSQGLSVQINLTLCNMTYKDGLLTSYTGSGCS